MTLLGIHVGQIIQLLVTMIVRMTTNELPFKKCTTLSWSWDFNGNVASNEPNAMKPLHNKVDDPKDTFIMHM